MRKLAFCICENKDAQLHGNRKLISTFVFTTLIAQSLYLLYTKFQASSHLVWLYSLVCVGPGRKLRRPFFSRGSNYNMLHFVTFTSVCYANHLPHNFKSIGLCSSRSTYELLLDNPTFSVLHLVNSDQPGHQLQFDSLI